MAEARARWDVQGGEEQQQQEEQVIPLWLDCDTGHDDAFAVLLAAQCPRIRLLGISTVHGNASLANVTKNTAAVLEAIGRRDVPVFPGAAKPFCREAVHAAAIHGESGLDGVTLLPEVTAPTSRVTALEAMYNALVATPRCSAWVVSTGALTNVALLFTVYPELVEHIKGLSIMGGAIGGFFTHAPMGRMKERLQLSQQINRIYDGPLPDFSNMPIAEVAAKMSELGIIKPPADGGDERVHMLLEQTRQQFGNWTPYAEFNIYCDPEAAQALFTNTALAAKTTLIPLDLTHQVCAGTDILSQIHGGTLNSPSSTLRAMFGQVITFFAGTYLHEFGMEDGPPLHDPLAVAAALAPGLFADHGGERFEVSVVCEGDDGLWEHRRNVAERVEQCGRTVVRKVAQGGSGVRIPRSVDVATFWAMLELSLARADAVSAINQ